MDVTSTRGAEDPLLSTLSDMIRIGGAAEIIDAGLTRVVATLDSSTEVMAWEVIPLSAFGRELPAAIRSCWIFVIRAGATTGAERHPNSHQRSISVMGSGRFELRRETEWRPHPLVSAADASVDQRGVSIPPSTWHRLFVGPDPWGMVSFHTVEADDLIEERPIHADDLDGPTHREYYAGR